ncbi:MAG TPA: glutamine-hydrolyzing GMP synthase, partial [Acidobacteriaceae bacterium]|nr:glutamine-hydrolyzing GMP synthase [Acidobacteriaceae bacterium]
MQTPSIVILDFGSQYTQLIARRIREQNVYSAVLPCTARIEEIRAHNPVGLVLSGGPCSVYDADAPPADPAVLDLGLPVLGICYGLQFITHHLGGRVRSAVKREYGPAEVALVEVANPLFAELPASLSVWMSHGDEALDLPPGFHLTAKTANAVAGMANPERRIWAVQFHPEVHHTPLGTQVLRNFLFRICGAQPDWTPAHFIQSTVATIQEKVGSGHAICALSGGVDSSVAAVLVHRAIEEQLTCVFVNNGVLRKDEFEKVQQNLRDKLGLKLVAVDASKRFLLKLRGVTDPEGKRKIIGNEFISVFDDEAA